MWKDIIIGGMILFINFMVHTVYHFFSFIAPDYLNTLMNIFHVILTAIGFGWIGYGINGWFGCQIVLVLYALYCVGYWIYYHYC